MISLWGAATHGGYAVVRGFKWTRAQRLILQLTATMVVIIQAVLVWQAMSRGLDYILLPSDVPTAQSLTYVESIVSLKVSGWIFFGGALATYVGMAIRQVPLAALGHFVIGMTYAVFAVGSLIEIAGRDDIFGWRTGTSWVTAAVVHGVFAVASEYAWRVARAK